MSLKLRVLLVNLGSLRMSGNEPIFPVGPNCLVSALREAGHFAEILDFAESPEAENDLDWMSRDWDIVGFSIRNIDPIDLSVGSFVPSYAEFVSRAVSVARQLENPPLLVGGGSGYSLFADYLLELFDLDVGVVGPGEATLLKIAADPEAYRGSRRNLTGEAFKAFQRHEVNYPTGLMQVYAKRKNAMIGVQTRRKTCYQKCVYCPYAFIDGDNAGQLKPPELLAKELRAIHASGIRRVFFTDAIFNSELSYAKSVCRMLAEEDLEGIVWSAYFMPAGFDAELAMLLKQSAVEQIVISPDSFDPDMLIRNGKRFGMKHIETCIERCREVGLKPLMILLLGGVGETRETIRRTAEFANAVLEADEVNINVGMRILPETEIASMSGLSPVEMIDPVFLPFDDKIFEWIMSDFDSRFLSMQEIMKLLLWRASVRQLQRIDIEESAQREVEFVLRRQS